MLGTFHSPWCVFLFVLARCWCVETGVWKTPNTPVLVCKNTSCAPLTCSSSAQHQQPPRTCLCAHPTREPPDKKQRERIVSCLCLTLPHENTALQLGLFKRFPTWFTTEIET